MEKRYGLVPEEIDIEIQSAAAAKIAYPYRTYSLVIDNVP